MTPLLGPTFQLGEMSVAPGAGRILVGFLSWPGGVAQGFQHHDKTRSDLL